MKTSLSMILAVAICVTSAAFATPVKVVDFSPGPGTAGNWTYNGAGNLTFDQNVLVDKGLGSNYDTLVGALVRIPAFEISGIPGAPYTLTPIGNNELQIRSADSSKVYMKGNLTSGDFVTIGTVAGGYTEFKTDITNVTITADGQALGSAALTTIAHMTHPSLDFALSLQGGSGAGYYSFAQMLDGGHTGSGGFSGDMSVPEPATMSLLTLGGLALLRRRRA